MIKYPDYDKLITSLLATDSIRFQKLLHMSQNAFLTAIFCFFVGIYFNDLFHTDDEIEETEYETLIKGFGQLILIIIVCYYLRKLVKFIPFIFRYTETYNPFHKSKDGESLVGAALATSLMIWSTQLNMKKRLSKMIEIYNPK
tara:strand:+ start:447 stop:875 length:429 start_codon:yes stop_codon:yes gene_type:complete